MTVPDESPVSCKIWLGTMDNRRLGFHAPQIPKLSLLLVLFYKYYNDIINNGIIAFGSVVTKFF